MMARGSLIRIGVQDIRKAEAFNYRVFGLPVARRFEDNGVEISGTEAP